jgi:predicted outer membrane repeat protein
MIVILFLLSMIFFMPPLKAYATSSNVYVDGSLIGGSHTGTDPSNAFNTIQEGISAVPTDGTVFVASGTYDENLVIPLTNKKITIEGADSSNTVINGGASGPVINVYHNGGGEETNDNLTIRNLAITNGQNGWGGGIYSTLARLEIYNCYIYNNHATSGGGGIYSTRTVIIDNCNISLNRAASGVFGGGIYISGTGNLDMDNSKIEDNHASELNAGIFGEGGGFCIRNSSGTISINNCSIVNNQVKSPALASSGLDADGAAIIVDARNNWWGSSTGPGGGATDPITLETASGSGDSIISASSPNVRFDPWLTSDPFPDSAAITLTPEDWVLMDLDVAELFDHYGASTEGFTKMLYDSILGRVPDAEGLNNWNNLLSNNLIGANQIVYNFIFSEELKNKISAMSNEEFINFLYKAILARTPDAEGYNNWLIFMGSSASKEEILMAFLNNEEWLNICRMFGVAP